jgi:uroporphyrinogen decarboxylase
MNSKQRVLTSFGHQQPDRVPIDYTANPGIDLRLKQHFGLEASDHEGLLLALGVDFRSVWASYAGPPLHQPIPDREIDIWGIHRRWVEHESGGYWDYCDFPLRDADMQTVQNWPMPNPDDFDYSQIQAECSRFQDYCVIAGNAGVGDIINSTGMIRNMEQVLIDLATDNPVGLYLIDRKIDVMVEVTRRILEAGQGGIDILFIGEDLGTQIGPMISKKLFRKQIRPRLQKFVDLGKAYHLPVMFHSCGSSSWAFEDFIEMGISIIDTLQPEAFHMQPAYLKENFGDRLSFHGSITTGGAVAFGTVAETIATVRETLETMMPGGGYALSPSHALQDNSPTENVIAIYETALNFGRYH